MYYSVPPPTDMVLIDSNSTTLKIGDPMPHFSLPATDGMIVNSHAIKDPVLVVIFTCNHCPYAKAYEERIKHMAETFDNEGCQFVLISSNDAQDYAEDSFACMKAKHDEIGYCCPYCYDESQEVAHAYGALCTPHCFVFDVERTLQYKGRIDDNWQNPLEVVDHSLQNAIEALLDGNTPKNQEVNAIGCSIKWKN